MLLVNLKSITYMNMETLVVDCMIDVPMYFIVLQRRMYLNMVQIANLLLCTSL